MKNLTLRAQLRLLGTSILLFILFILCLSAYILSRTFGTPFVAVVKQMIPVFAISIPYLLFIVFFLADILRGSAEPLQSLEGTVKQISEGDLTKKTGGPVLGLKEEYANLAHAIERMRENIGVMITGIKSEADGISKAVGGIRSHINGMSGEMEDIFIAAEELSDSLKEAEEAADRIGRISGSIQGAASHMAVRAKEGEEWAKDIRERAQYAKETALDKSDAVRSSKKDIRDSLAKTLNDAKVIEQISVLAESVVEITGQVNLLSLNAGIEAARAGERGKEFATVAEEIRNLTDQSKKYAENIQWAIDEVTSALVSLRKDAKRLLEFIDRDVSPSFNLFVRMADTYNSDAGEMNFMASDVGATSEELLAFVGEITDSVGEIKKAAAVCSGGVSGIADQSVRAAARVSSVSDHFKGMEEAVARLEKESAQFGVDGNGEGGR